MSNEFRKIRRQNRILEDENRIIELLESSEYGFLSVGVTEKGYNYGIPLSYAYDKESNILYFHCATEGQKLDLMKQNNKVSFCIVGITKPIADEFSTYYESVISFGKVALDLNDDEKRKALRLLVKKYSVGYEQSGEIYMEKSWNRTNVFKIQIEHITAKAKYI